MSSGGGKNLLRVRSQFDDNVSGPLDKVRDRFDQIGKSKGAQSILQGVGMGAGISAFGMLQGAIERVGDVAFDSIAKASDLREAVSLGDQVFEGSADKIKAWATTAGESMGSSKSEAVSMAALFGTQFKLVGASLEEAGTKSIELAELAGDLGSTFNTSSEEAANALRSGLLGESEPMRKFGSNLSAARVEAYLLGEGVKKTGGKFTDAELVLGRYNLMLQDTKDSTGMFGRDTESLADQQKMLKAEIENVQAAIGTDLMPVMRDLSVWAREEGVPMIGGLKDAFKSLGEGWDLLPKAGDEGWHGMKTSIDKLREATDLANIGVETLGNGITRNLRPTLEDLPGSAGPAAGAIDDVGDEAKETDKQLDNMKDALGKASQAFIDATFGPEQLKTELKLAQGDARDAVKELDALLKPDGKPVKGATWKQINEAKLEVSESKERVSELSIKLASMGEMSFPQLVTELGKVKVKLDLANDEAWNLVNALGKVGVLSGDAPVIQPGRGGGGARASGGPVYPGEMYRVGERGEETLVMGNTGGYVIPHGGGSSGGGTFNFNVTVAGGIIDPNGSAAQEIARQLVYAFKREVNRQGISLTPG